MAETTFESAAKQGLLHDTTSARLHGLANLEAEFHLMHHAVAGVRGGLFAWPRGLSSGSSLGAAYYTYLALGGLGSDSTNSSVKALTVDERNPAWTTILPKAFAYEVTQDFYLS